MKSTRWIIALLSSAVALGQSAADDRHLISRAPRAAAQVEPQAPAPAAPGAPADDELTARAEANLAVAKLELVLARKAARANDLSVAARQAQHALILIRQLPSAIDASDLEFQAEGILARAAQAGVNITALERDAAAQAPLDPDDAELDRDVQGAAAVARQYEGPPRRDIDASGDARALRDRTIRRQAGDCHAYRPAAEIVDVDAILARSRARTVYQGALEQAYSEDEARILVNADEARLVPESDVAYPPDWPQRVARRSQWAGGQIARSPSWFDKDGREWYVAIYDVRDLIYVPPDFLRSAWVADHRFRPQMLQDREALRENSFIFRGWTGWESLEFGIPLLRYFGGVDPWIDRGPKYSPEKQRELVRMIQAFVGGEVEAISTPVPLPLAPGAPLGPPGVPIAPPDPGPRR